MNEPSHPSDIAREAFRQLALRRIAPTPDNYQTLYHEIAGTAADDTFPERPLKLIAASLPRHNHEALRIARDFDTAVAQADWNKLGAVIADALGATNSQDINWGSLLRDLIAEWDRRQAGLTQARKREMLDRVLSASGTNPERLAERLQGLLRAWTRNADDDDPAVACGDTAPAASRSSPGCWPTCSTASPARPGRPTPRSPPRRAPWPSPCGSSRVRCPPTRSSSASTRCGPASSGPPKTSTPCATPSSACSSSSSRTSASWWWTTAGCTARSP
jgi:hypothetical protein